VAPRGWLVPESHTTLVSSSHVAHDVEAGAGSLEPEADRPLALCVRGCWGS
jgi:hypothetical protein